MSLRLSDVVVYGFVLAAGVLMIVSTLLHRAGVTWRFTRGSKGRPVPVGASLLLGAGFVVISGTHLVPADHQPAWGLMMLLKSLALCLCLASLVMFTISSRKPRPDNPEHN
jgi:uncharacterized membrane protein SirB2